MKGEWLFLLLLCVISVSVAQRPSRPAHRGGACNAETTALKMQFRSAMRLPGGKEDLTFLVDYAKKTYDCPDFTSPQCQVRDIAKKIHGDIAKMRSDELLALIGGAHENVLKSSEILRACLATKNHSDGFQERNTVRVQNRLAEALRFRLTEQVISDALSGKIPNLPQRKFKRADGNETDLGGDGVVENDNGYQNYDEYYDNAGGTDGTSGTDGTGGTGGTGNTDNTGDNPTDTTTGGPGDANVGDTSEGTKTGFNTGGDNAGNIGPGGEVMGQSGYYDDVFVDDLGSYVKSTHTLNIGDVIAVVILTTILFVLALAIIVQIADKLFPGEVYQKL